MEENWKRWKKNPFSRYSRNLFLKGMIEEWNEEEDEED